jgi:hypothetical protein
VSNNDIAIPFEIPHDFVIERAMPTGPELAFGVSNGWLKAEDAVAIATERLRRGHTLSRPEESLALLLAEDIDQIHAIVADLQVSSAPVESRARLWLYLALDWLHQHRDKFADSWQTIELIFGEFDYPNEMASFVRWMPYEGPGTASFEAMEGEWSEFLRAQADHYSSRSPS